MGKYSRSPEPSRTHDDRGQGRGRRYEGRGIDTAPSKREKNSTADDYDLDSERKRHHRSRSREKDDASHRKRDRSRSRDPERKDKKFVLRRFITCIRILILYVFRRKRDKSEERKARKAEKKRIKEEEEARQVAELSVYSATDNPFHDVNLGQQFRWHKKNEKEKKQGLSIADSQRRDALRRQEATEELERLNRRRAEREVEQRLREEEDLRMQRMQESAQMSEWLAKDGDFQLEQEKRRATIRIKEKRAKAIDFLALNLKYVNPPPDDENAVENEEDAGLEIDLEEPYNILDVCACFSLVYLEIPLNL